MFGPAFAMHRRDVLAGLGGCALLAAGCTTAATATPGQRLAALLRASDEAALARHPWRALQRGNLRYAGRFGDYLSDAHLPPSAALRIASSKRSLRSTAARSPASMRLPTTHSLAARGALLVIVA